MGSLVGLSKGGSARYRDGRCEHHQGEKLPASRNFGCIGRQAELKRFNHALKIRHRYRFCEDHKHSPARGRASQGEAVPGSLLSLGCDPPLKLQRTGIVPSHKYGPECDALPIAHHAYVLSVPIEIRPHIRTAMTADAADKPRLKIG
jgi:hypothetical protein